MYHLIIELEENQDEIELCTAFGETGFVGNTGLCYLNGVINYVFCCYRTFYILCGYVYSCEYTNISVVYHEKFMKGNET